VFSFRRDIYLMDAFFYDSYNADICLVKTFITRGENGVRLHVIVRPNPAKNKSLLLRSESPLMKNPPIFKETDKFGATSFSKVFENSRKT
jgi:hypothetical protein